MAPRNENKVDQSAHVNRPMEAAQHEPSERKTEHAYAGADQPAEVPADETLIDHDPRKQRLRRRQSGNHEPEQERRDERAELRLQVRPQQRPDTATLKARG